MSKTATGLVEYCHAQLGRPYWMGTFGQIATQALLNAQRSRADIKQYYTASDFPSQFGQRVHDCIGMVKGYVWSDGPDSPPGYAINGMPDWNQDMVERATPADKKGKLTTMPDVPGILVYFPGHVGIYIGNGEVIEARGHAYGVVKTKLNERGWKTWGYCPYVSYEEQEEGTEVVYKTIEEVPDWGRPTIQKLVDKGLLQGDETGLDLNQTMLRIFVVHDRAGLYD